VAKQIRELVPPEKMDKSLEGFLEVLEYLAVVLLQEDVAVLSTEGKIPKLWILAVKPFSGRH
jgi:hypothetical protein